jgi:hypothetical protein
MEIVGLFIRVLRFLFAAPVNLVTLDAIPCMLEPDLDVKFR